MLCLNLTLLRRFVACRQNGSGDALSKDIPENPLLGSLMYLRHCRGCQEKSGRIERFVDLSLTLPEARNVSLSSVNGGHACTCTTCVDIVLGVCVCARASRHRDS